MATLGATLELTEEEKLELAKALENHYWSVHSVYRNYQERMETVAQIATEKRLESIAIIYHRLTGKYICLTAISNK